MASLAPKLIAINKGRLNRLICQLSQRLDPLKPAQISADYKVWRDQFLWRRLGLCMWIAVAVVFTSNLLDCYRMFYLNTTVFYPKALNYFLIIENLTTALLLFVGLILRQSQWGHRHPGALFLYLSWSIALTLQAFSTLLGFVRLDASNWSVLAMAQATLMPVRWRLHLLSQLGPLAYYIGVNSLVGLREASGQPLVTVELLVYLFWFYFICNLGVYLYDRLQRTEFESRRELQVFLHAIYHDLRTPLMGTAVVLQNLLKKSDLQENSSKRVLQRLLEGNSRQINLINSLREAATLETHRLRLHRQPLQLSTVVTATLWDLQPLLTQKQIILKNQVSTDLPLVNADAVQLGRVFSNLIINALKHNPYGISLVLEASVKGRLLLCQVKDDGVGIDPTQVARVFEPYSRGEKARFMPGLGLGLYVCRQIIIAHGGEVGVKSHWGNGSTFWFTLPLTETSD
jgi:signal transduction histidine kinase